MSPEMVRPSPIPDELSCGYFGRIKRLNGYNTEKEAWENIGPQTDAKIHRNELAYLEMLALVAGQEPEIFMRNHSIYACRRVIDLAQVGHQRAGWALGHRRTLGSRIEMHFCIECCREDRSFHGVGIWRRSHHFPGQGRCFRHKSILRTASDPLAYLSTPVDCVEGSALIDLSAHIEYERNDAIQRFYAIYEDLLIRPSRFTRLKVFEAMANQAEIRGFSPRSVKRHRHGDLSMLAIVSHFRDEFPATWLLEVMPEKCEHWIPDLFRPSLRLPAAAYILALAAFFHSVEAAMNALMETPVRGGQAADHGVSVRSLS